jgi:hypothetical protein
LQFAHFLKLISNRIALRWVALGLAALATPAMGTTARAEWKIPIKPGFYAPRTSSCDQGNMSAYFAQLTFWGDSVNNSWTERTIRSVARNEQAYVLTLQTSQNGVQGQNGGPERATWELKVADAEHISVKGRDHGENWSGAYRWCAPLPSEARQAVKANAEYAASLRTSSPALTQGANETRIDTASGEVAGEQGFQFIHNDSRVWLFPKAGVIAYAEPKRSIAGTVKPGDILFRGRIGTGEIAGTAYVFKAGCAPAPYPVSGSGFHGGKGSMRKPMPANKESVKMAALGENFRWGPR